MKTNTLFKSARALRSVLLAAFTLFGSGAMQAANFFDDPITITGTAGGTIDLLSVSGDSVRGNSWAIFALQGGVTITSSSFPGQANVIGNVGVAQGGTLTMSNTWIGGTGAGKAYLRNGAVPSVVGSLITGGFPLLNQDPILNPAAGDAYAAASVANGLSRDIGAGPTLLTTIGLPAGILSNDTTQILLSNVSGSIIGAANATYVLNLTNLLLSGASGQLILSGAATTNYVINVDKYLSMTSGSKITLSGGLQPQNVLFNVRNSGGYDVTMSGAGTELNGILLAPGRNVKMTGGAQITGEVIARAVSLSGNSRVINPVVSP